MSPYRVNALPTGPAGTRRSRVWFWLCSVIGCDADRRLHRCEHRLGPPEANSTPNGEWRASYYTCRRCGHEKYAGHMLIRAKTIYA